MADEGAAISMVNYFSNGTSAQLRGRNVFVQYSNHTQLKTDQSHSNAVSLLIESDDDRLSFLTFVNAECCCSSCPASCSSFSWTDGDSRRTQYRSPCHRRAYGLSRYPRCPLSGNSIPAMQKVELKSRTNPMSSLLFRFRHGSLDLGICRMEKEAMKILNHWLEFSLYLCRSFPKSVGCWRSSLSPRTVRL